MDDRATEWLRYLESKLSEAQADFRARSTITVPSAVVLLVGSFIFIDTGGEMILGLIGSGIAVLVLVASVVYNLKSIVFISGCDRIIRRILLGQLVESAEINRQFEDLIVRYSAKSASTEGLEIVKRTTGKQS